MKTRLFNQRAKLYSQLLIAEKRGQVRPVVVDLFITSRCNAECDYCYAIHKPILRKEELTTDQWIEVIDDLHDLGCRMINLMGGEPLLRKDFGAILDHITEKGIECDVNTNCFLVEEHLGSLKKASQIFTSIDGDEKAHDLNRGVGTFRRTLDGIIAARAANIPVRINCTVTKHNLHSTEYLIDFAKEHGVYVTFTPMIRATKKLEQRAAKMTPEDEEAKDVFRQIKAAKATTDRITNTDKSLDFFIDYPVPIGTVVRRDESGPHVDYYDKECPYGRVQFFVVSNGDVYSCHNMWNDPATNPKNVILHGTEEALLHTNRELWCKYCWLANLVEWNELASPNWLVKGVKITIEQSLGGKITVNTERARGSAAS